MKATFTPPLGAARREVLGADDVDDDQLAAMVADLWGVPGVRLVDSSAEPVAYDVPSLLTGARTWVRGRADAGDGPRAFTLFVKRVHNWRHSPAFASVPPEIGEWAAASLPWRAEPLVYASDLAGRLPDGPDHAARAARGGARRRDRGGVDRGRRRRPGPVEHRRQRARGPPPRSPLGQRGRRAARRDRPAAVAHRLLRERPPRLHRPARPPRRGHVAAPRRRRALRRAARGPRRDRTPPRRRSPRSSRRAVTSPRTATRAPTTCCVASATPGSPSSTSASGARSPSPSTCPSCSSATSRSAARTSATCPSAPRRASSRTPPGWPTRASRSPLPRSGAATPSA